VALPIGFGWVRSWSSSLRSGGRHGDFMVWVFGFLATLDAFHVVSFPIWQFPFKIWVGVGVGM
jgi:hypothetical protein